MQMILMEEIDGIIVDTLRGVGCEIDSEITDLSNFSPELTVETVAKCLKIIRPNIYLPKSLPSIITHRYMVASSLVDACTSIGFNGDIGYHTFLYSNVADMRKLYMFLIEMLPKECSEKFECKRLASINVQLNKILCVFWTPRCCNTGVERWLESLIFQSGKTIFHPQLSLFPFGLAIASCQSSEEKYWFKKSPNLLQQTRNYSLCASVVNATAENAVLLNEWKSHHKKEFFTNFLARCKSCFDRVIIPNKIYDYDENKMQDDKGNNNLLYLKKQITILKCDVNIHKQSIKENMLNQKKLSEKERKIQDFCIVKQSAKSKLQIEKKIFERVCIVLDIPKENIIKMEGLINALRLKKAKLTAEWKKNRWEILQKLEILKATENVTINKNCIRRKIKAVQEHSSKIEKKKQVKNILYSLMSNELQVLDLCSHRNTFISRIVEITDSIRKQSNGVHNVISDTKDIQKQITAISGILDRQFTVTDDALYSMAKKNDYSKKAYKLLAALHLYFSELIILVQSIGGIMREMRELEDHVEEEKIKNVSSNLEKVTSDLNKVQQEKASV